MELQSRLFEYKDAQRRQPAARLVFEIRTYKIQIYKLLLSQPIRWQCKWFRYYDRRCQDLGAAGAATTTQPVPKWLFQKRANNFTGRGTYELLLTRLQTCGRFGFISQRARTVFYSISAGKSRPAVTESYPVPLNFPATLSVLKWKLLWTLDWLCKTYELEGPCTRRNIYRLLSMGIFDPNYHNKLCKCRRSKQQDETEPTQTDTSTATACILVKTSSLFQLPVKPVRIIIPVILW